MESDLVCLSEFCQLKRQKGRDLLICVSGSLKRDSSDVIGFRGLNDVIISVSPSLACLPLSWLPNQDGFPHLVAEMASGSNVYYIVFPSCLFW